MAATRTNCKGTSSEPNIETSQVPEWLTAEIFDGVLEKNFPAYQNIRSFKAFPGLAAGENYATLMLRVEIEMELKDGEVKSVSYMLKLPHDLAIMNELTEATDIFALESDMYKNVVPEMEQLLRDAGVEVRFGAKCFVLPEHSQCIMLEDLKPLGFKNANRLDGLDMEHTKSVLKKLAQWHAASATRVETKGRYADEFNYGFFNEKNKGNLKAIFDGLGNSFAACLKTYKGQEVYGDSVLKLQAIILEEMLKLIKIDHDDFNVLNHGDCWSNNIMFQYDEHGKIKETYLVDYQIPKYGSPSHDLIYLLISSTSYDLKLSRFDFFIKFYHDNLVAHLKMLKYPKKIPTLKDIHIMLYNYGVWAYYTATGVMGAVLVDPSEEANLKNFFSDDEEAKNFKLLMYSNPRYEKHIEAILPWLYNRGALEC